MHVADEGRRAWCFSRDYYIGVIRLIGSGKARKQYERANDSNDGQRNVLHKVLGADSKNKRLDFLKSGRYVQQKLIAAIRMVTLSRSSCVALESEIDMESNQ